MALPSSGQVSFNDVRTEISQSTSPNYNISDWTSGAWISGSFSFNCFAPVNLLSSGSRFHTGSNFNPYLDNDISSWYSYNHFLSIQDDGATPGTYLYTHTGFNHCCPSSMIVVDIGTQDKAVVITLSGSADALFENVYVYYGKPWENNGKVGGVYQLITASGHFFPPYTGDIDLDFTWNYRYTASLGQYLYIVIYGDYCTNNNLL